MSVFNIQYKSVIGRERPYLSNRCLDDFIH